MEKTLQFAKRLRPDTAQFFPIMVYPGTQAYQQARERGYIKNEDWGAWLTKDGLHNSVVTLPGITHEQLVSFCDNARRRFYLSPAYLGYKFMQSIRDPREFERNIKGFLTLSKYLLFGSRQHKANETALRVEHSAKKTDADLVQIAGDGRSRNSERVVPSIEVAP